ncbi:hypothetical protein FPV67DRAFT_1196239 [Lyophyllum atratum]|nr:hypothetical protein FPV67DRAFT_1196239 [Lyophyllum atratum]
MATLNPNRNHTALEAAAVALDSSTSNVNVLRNALRMCQTALDAAERDVQRLRIENATLKAAAEGPASASGPTAAKTDWIKHDSLLIHKKEITSEAKKFMIYNALWMPDSAFTSSGSIQVDTDVQSRYTSDEAYAAYVASMLYTRLPPKFHSFLEKLPAFHTAFLHQHGQGRVALVKVVRDHAPLIFSSIPDIPTQSWSREYEGRRSDPAFRKLLRFDVNSVSPDMYPPIIHHGLKNGPGPTMFRNQVLIKTGRAILFGAGGITSGSKIQRNSAGIRWGPQKDLFGFISLCTSLVVLLASGDTHFGEAGKPGEIQHGHDYRVRKRFLEKNAGTLQSNELLRFWHEHLYKGVPGSFFDAHEEGEVFPEDPALDEEEAAMRAFAGDEALSGNGIFLSGDDLLTMTPSLSTLSLSQSSFEPYSEETASAPPPSVSNIVQPASLPHPTYGANSAAPPLIPAVLSAFAPTISASEDLDLGPAVEDDVDEEIAVGIGAVSMEDPVLSAGRGSASSRGTKRGGKKAGGGKKKVATGDPAPARATRSNTRT